MVIGGVLPSAVIYRSPNPISLSFFPTHPSSSSSSCRLCIHCPLDAHSNNFRSVRARGFRFRDEAEADGYAAGGMSGGSRTREKRTWWTDGSAEEDFEDEDYDFDDDEPESIWDKIWIFKVFKAYGYFLPAIIASMLLASGPKAFLMALALPLGQSALSIVFEKVVGKENGRTRRRSKAKKWTSDRSSYGSRSRAVREEEEGRSGPGYGKDYKSWVSTDATEAGQKSAPQQPVGGYGGWDELDRREFRKAKRPSAGAASRAQDVKREKLTRRGRSKDLPFFWRMLVAVFPFLGSWTKLL